MFPVFLGQNELRGVFWLAIVSFLAAQQLRVNPDAQFEVRDAESPGAIHRKTVFKFCARISDSANGSQAVFRNGLAGESRAVQLGKQGMCSFRLKAKRKRRFT